MKKVFLSGALLCTLLLTDKGLTLNASPLHHASAASRQIFHFYFHYEDGTKISAGWLRIGGKTYRIIDGCTTADTEPGYYYSVTDDNNPSMSYHGLLWRPNGPNVDVNIPNNRR